eukprot:scaffold8100_cov117-Isochrysis_galbana.AAC.9
MCSRARSKIKIPRYLTPPKGVWEGPRALIHLPRNTRCRFLFPPPCAFLASSPCAWEVCLLSCWGIGSPSPAANQGRGIIVWGRKQPTSDLMQNQ